LRVIIRSWCCLNRHCVHQWDGEGDHPPCPRCGGLRVKWIPRPVAFKSERTKEIDRTVSQLTATYGDKNYRSPRSRESMAPRINPVPVSGKTMRFTPTGMVGWSADLPIDQNGNPVPVCTTTGVTAKLPIQGLEAKVPQNQKLAKATPQTTYHARWQPPGGIPK
jgi:hypothetical protein